MIINSNEDQYLQLCRTILNKGHKKPDRTGTGTISFFGYQMRFNLQKGFPLLTTKFVPFRLIKSELLWFIHGDTNLRFLLKHHNHIWDEWPFKKWTESNDYHGPDMTDFGHRRLKNKKFNTIYQKEMHKFLHLVMTNDNFDKKYGSIGSESYGRQWRNFGIANYRKDQLKWAINKIKRTPYSRRIIVSAWNPLQLQNMDLPPCHTLFQFYVNNGYLSCQLYQRSGDTFLGVPFNIASYALLTSLIAKECHLRPGIFIHTLGDAHIYLNHIQQVKKLLTRRPYCPPKLWLNPSKKSIFDYATNDIKVLSYKHHSYIPAPISV